MEQKKIIKLAVAVILVLAAVLGLSGILTGHSFLYHLKNRGDLGPLTRSDIEYVDVEAPEATSADGTVTASDWEAVYPDIVVSMGEDEANSYVIDYLQQDPYLTNIYEGYGFAKDYGSARGHSYTLTDVAKTQRPHPKANCLTCKTPNFTKMVNDQGVGVYAMPFDEVMAQMEETVSCYTCHGNDAGNAGQITITHSYVGKALGDGVSAIDASVLSCGQCHIEYYFTREDSETMMPYHGVDGMTPDAILAYYDEMGFYDWVQESTGAKMLKAQHPEMETFLTRIQGRVTARETEVGNALSDCKDSLAAAVASGDWSEEDLDPVRVLYREAQWYFDYCYVENSEGAHNSELSMYCLDTAQSKIDKGASLLAEHHAGA